jgi:hypothetical protein
VALLWVTRSRVGPAEGRESLFDVSLKDDGQRKGQTVVFFGLPVSKSGILVEESA